MKESERERVRSQTPLKRLGEVDEVASAAFLLATNQFMTGSIMNVDGGVSA